jgi:hypothetical protein
MREPKGIKSVTRKREILGNRILSKTNIHKALEPVQQPVQQPV